MPIIKNVQEIVRNTENILDAKAREAALIILEAAISAIDPKRLVKEKVRLVEHNLVIGNLSLDLNDYNRILVVGGGKATGRMAEALEETLENRIDYGIVNIPRGTARNFKTGIIELNEAGHPIPDEGGIKGAKKIMELLRELDEKTLVITLLSGGGSALLPFPQRGISLEEKQDITNLLLRCGATIEEINVVRKHISRIKGGRLAAYAFPATILCLIISDVVGDHLPSIASGPTVPDPSTFSEAVEVLKHFYVWEKAPYAVRKCLNNGLLGKYPESPKPDDFRLSRVHNIILGNNRAALEAAELRARELGFNALILSSYIEGEARHVGSVFSSLAREMIVTNHPIAKPGILLAGGETTVTVTGSGKGGRNQETVLSSSIRLAGLMGTAIASVGTDGLDGISDAARAIIDGSTLKRALDKGLEPIKYLMNNDSYHFFKALNDLIFTGPTGTNVNDIMVLVALNSEGMGS